MNFMCNNRFINSYSIITVRQYIECTPDHQIIMMLRDMGDSAWILPRNPPSQRDRAVNVDDIFELIYADLSTHIAILS